MPTSEELFVLAERCAARLSQDGSIRHLPSFSDAEEQCEAEYEALLVAVHEDEVFAPVNIQRQEQLVQSVPVISILTHKQSVIITKAHLPTQRFETYISS